MPIRVLSPEVVVKIAAGEVVERPASVVKELAENSLDARAAEISVEAKGGGVAMIRVADNGCGIPAVEASLAFHRHATNKISGIKDLENIKSLGFRGEALASIAAVAQVEMLTQTQQEEAGLYLLMKDGIMAERASRVRTVGTTVTVRNLFSSVPARLKFLKSAATENSHIANIINQYALAYPEVKFILYLEGRLSLRTPGNGNLSDTIAAVYGSELGQAMLETEPQVSAENRDIRVNGYISLPAISRANSSYMSFFINRRWVRSRTLNYAVEEAYKGLLMTGKHPVAILNINLPFAEVDVNVHPTKMEVRFRNEHAVFLTVQKVVRQTLLRQSPVPQIEVKPGSQVDRGEAKQILWADLSTQAPLATGAKQPLPLKDMRSTLASPAIPILRVLGQLSNTYIIAEGPEGLYLIDQHAAHERILYEELMAQKTCQEVIAQGMLEPLAVELNSRQEEVLKEKEQALSEFGFTLESFGERSYLVRAVPAVIKDRNISEILIGVIDDLAEGKSNGSWEETIAVSLACHGSVKAGQTLNDEEMRELVRLLEKSKVPRTCPHGRPTMLHLNSGKLEKEFGRR